MPDDQYIHAIRNFYAQHHRMPSYREIIEITGLRSTGSVAKLIHRLEQQGVLTKDRTGRLIPEKPQLSLLGSVAAGFPTPTEQELGNTLSIDEFLIETVEKTYLLKVSGDSMQDAGILHDDLLVVERTTAPRVGQIVVAVVDGDWTVKYLRKKRGKLVLEAANPEYPDIIPEDELRIAAIVKGVVRKY